MRVRLNKRVIEQAAYQGPGADGPDGLGVHLPPADDEAVARDDGAGDAGPGAAG